MGIKNIRLNRSGFSLIEALIAGSIMMAIIYAVATSMSSSYKSVGSVEKSMVFNDLIADLQHFAADTQSCTGSLGGSTPAIGAHVPVTFGGLHINDTASSPGSFFQSQIKITSLTWVDIKPVPPSGAIGYLSVTANLQGNVTALSTTTIGGNMRTYPKPGSVPGGIMVMMALDASGKVTTCGGNIDTNAAGTATQFVNCPIANDIHDGHYVDASCNFTTPFIDNNYIVTCNLVSPGAATSYKNFGQFYIVSTSPGSFAYHYYQERGNYVAPSSLSANCVAHHN